MATSNHTAETKSRLNTCWKTNLDWDLYSDKVRYLQNIIVNNGKSIFRKSFFYCQVCNKIGKAMSMPPTAVLSGLSIIVSFMLAHSTVQVEGTQWKEPVIMWLTIGMPTRSSKSSLFRYFLELLCSTCSKANVTGKWKIGLLMSNNKC